MPRVWKELLENLARIMAAEETHNLTWHDLIRRAVKEDPSFQMHQSRHSAHSTYLCRYHLTFCSKFRFNVLKDGVDETLKEIPQKICDRYRYEVQPLKGMPDHIHLFLSAPQTAAPADIAGPLKAFSAIELFKAYPDLKHFYLRCGRLWSNGYFMATAGDTSAEAIKKYIEDQKSH